MQGLLTALEPTRKLARGPRQRAILEAMLSRSGAEMTPPTKTLARRLYHLGYSFERRPPRPGHDERLYLISYSEDEASRRQCAAHTLSTTDPRSRDLASGRIDQRLVALDAVLTPDEWETLLSVAPEIDLRFRPNGWDQRPLDLPRLVSAVRALTAAPGSVEVFLALCGEWKADSRQEATAAFDELVAACVLSTH